jgi:hypothetical protein
MNARSSSTVPWPEPLTVAATIAPGHLIARDNRVIDLTGARRVEFRAEHCGPVEVRRSRTPLVDRQNHPNNAAVVAAPAIATGPRAPVTDSTAAPADAIGDELIQPRNSRHRTNRPIRTRPCHARYTREDSSAWCGYRLTSQPPHP